MTNELREAAENVVAKFTEVSVLRTIVDVGIMAEVVDALRTALSRDDAVGDAVGKAREAGLVEKIRTYAVKSAAACREAEQERTRDLRSGENGTIGDMLREQRYAWEQKAASYDALVAFIDALLQAEREKGGGS